MGREDGREGKAPALNAGDAKDAGKPKGERRVQHSEEDRIVSVVVDRAMRVHTALGPGLLESVYEACLVHELAKAGLAVRRQHPISVRYDGLLLDAGFRVDLLVNDLVVIEVKSVDKLAPIHTAQLLTYLRLGGHKLGLLLNFNVTLMREGIKRVANGL